MSMANKTPQSKVTYVDPAFQVPDDVIGIEQSESAKTVWVKPETSPYPSDVGIFGDPVSGQGGIISIEDVASGNLNSNTDSYTIVSGEYVDSQDVTFDIENEEILPEVDTPVIVEITAGDYSIGPSGTPMASVVVELDPVAGADRYEFRVSAIAN